MYKVFKCPEVQSIVHPLIPFVLDSSKSEHSFPVYRSPYFSSDTGVAGMKVLFSVQDMFVVWHRIFELTFIDTFHAELELTFVDTFHAELDLA